MTKWERILEDAIIGRTIAALADAGFTVEATYRGDHLDLTAKNEKGGVAGFVILVYGNGADVLSDYAVGLESVIAPVNQFAAQFQS